MHVPVRASSAMLDPGPGRAGFLWVQDREDRGVGGYSFGDCAGDENFGMVCAVGEKVKGFLG